MSRDNIPPGSWGGDFGNDLLGNEYRIRQARRFDQIHAQEEVRRKAAEANAGKLIVKRQEQPEIHNDQHFFDDEIYANINQAGPGDGSENAQSENIKRENSIKIRRPLKKMSFVKQSPDFSAGQAVSWMVTLRNLIENNQINYQIIIEAMKVASELQYALAEALDNLR